MTGDAVDAIARALLYEGYLLYPYRPSALKNRQRFNFGVLYPRACSASLAGADTWEMQTECPVRGSDAASIDVTVRCLHLATRGVEEGEGWQEAVEREVAVPRRTLGELEGAPARQAFSWPASLEDDRRQEPVDGAIEVSAERASPDAFRLRVRVENLTPADDGTPLSRDQALARALVSTHTILRISGGELVSLLDPADGDRALAAGCVNAGTWPVLVGEAPRRDCMLSSPIILYDYPQIAPESAGDLFDGTEIDEILALRILTMTDEEKREARAADDRARHVLDRTENLPPEHFAKLHGAVRGLRRASEGSR